MNSYNYYLNKPVSNVEESIGWLNTLCAKLQSTELSLDEKVTALEKVFYLLNETVPMDLKELTWSVSTLDREQDSPVLNAAFNALNELQNTLQMLNGAVSSNELFTISGPVREEIHTLNSGHMVNAILCTHEKIAKLMQSEPLPSIGEMQNGGQISSAEADLALSKREFKPASSSHSNGFWRNLSSKLVFYPGKFYNPIPVPVSYYIQSSSHNSPTRVADIISMIKGEQMSTMPKAIFDDDGDIGDKYGEFVMVPSVFAADLARMKMVTINGTTYYDKAEYMSHNAYNPNECARELYRQLGKIGGERFMQVCQQGMMAHFLEFMIFPMIAPDGAWGKLLEGKFVNPSNASGFIVDLKVDHEKNQVIFSRKLLMKLHVEEETAFTAHFVAKTDFSIPIDELTRNDFMQNDNPAPNLHVTDTISTLVMNNPKEAMELLYKF